MQTAELVAVKEETRMIVGECVRAVKTPELFRKNFPKMKILLGSAHLLRMTATRVGERKQIKQSIVYQPRQRNRQMFRLRLFQLRWASMKASQHGIFLPCRQITFHLAQHATSNLRADQRMTGPLLSLDKMSFVKHSITNG